MKNLNKKKGAASTWGPATDSNLIQQTEWEAIAAEGGTSLTFSGGRKTLQNAKDMQFPSKADCAVVRVRQALEKSFENI